jgi:hypothetical protein
MKKFVEVKSLSAPALKSLADKAAKLADALDMDASAATPNERFQIAIVSASLRRHAESFKRFAPKLAEGTLPPRKTLSDMQWVAERFNERVRNGQPVERPDARAFSARGKSSFPRKKSVGDGRTVPERVQEGATGGRDA